MAQWIGDTTLASTRSLCLKGSQANEKMVYSQSIITDLDVVKYDVIVKMSCSDVARMIV